MATDARWRQLTVADIAAARTWMAHLADTGPHNLITGVERAGRPP
ncbi:hypothetical protein ACFRI7_02185 [Streptomyces sp. NPDC056716]